MAYVPTQPALRNRVGFYGPAYSLKIQGTGGGIVAPFILNPTYAPLLNNGKSTAALANNGKTTAPIG